MVVFDGFKIGRGMQMSTSKAESYIKLAISILEQAEKELKSAKKWLSVTSFFWVIRDKFQKTRIYLGQVQAILDKLEKEYKYLSVPLNASLDISPIEIILGGSNPDSVFPRTKIKRCLAEILALKASLEEMLLSLDVKNRYSYL